VRRGYRPESTLSTAGPGATGPIGSATVTPVVTIDAKGRVTGLTSATIAGLSPISETALSGTTVLTSAALGKMQACTVATAYTVTLPTPVGCAGSQVGIRVTPGSTNLLTLATAAGNIDGAATRIMWAGESAMVESDGTNWVKIAGKAIPMVGSVYRSAAQSIANASQPTISHDSTIYDGTGLMCDVVTNHRINILRPAPYSISAVDSLATSSASALRFALGILRSGVSIRAVEMSFLANSFPSIGLTTQNINCAAGDYITTNIYQTSGVAINTGTSEPFCTLEVTEISSW
jgi:hypothetical protein